MRDGMAGQPAADGPVRIAVMFPGQGAQQVGMGKALAARFPVARQTFDEANDVLGYDLAELCFEGPHELLTTTAHCQPAVLVTSVAAYRVAEEHGLRGHVALGHSLGEYTALVACGSLGFADALRLVVERGAATGQVVADHPGSMAALIGASDEDVEALCAEAGEVWPANYNCPGQVVASGLSRGVERLIELARTRGIAAKRLTVDGAFHSAVMAPAVGRLREALGTVRIQAGSLQFVSATSAAVEKGERRLRGLLASQLTAPVRFAAAVRTSLDLGVTGFVEFGHRRILVNLVRRVRGDVEVFHVGAPEDLPAVLALAAR